MGYVLCPAGFPSTRAGGLVRSKGPGMVKRHTDSACTRREGGHSEGRKCSCGALGPGSHWAVWPSRAPMAGFGEGLWGGGGGGSYSLARRLVHAPDPEDSPMRHAREALDGEGPSLHGLEDDKTVLRFLSRGRVQPYRGGRFLLRGAPALDHGDLGGGPSGATDGEETSVGPGLLPMPGGGPRARWAAGAAGPGAGLQGSHPSPVTGLATPPETFRRPVSARHPLFHPAYRHSGPDEPKVGHGRRHRVAKKLPGLSAAPW